jgi:hypothetical protein
MKSFKFVILLSAVVGATPVLADEIVLPTFGSSGDLVGLVPATSGWTDTVPPTFGDTTVPPTGDDVPGFTVGDWSGGLPTPPPIIVNVGQLVVLGETAAHPIMPNTVVSSSFSAGFSSSGGFSLSGASSDTAEDYTAIEIPDLTLSDSGSQMSFSVADPTKMVFVDPEVAVGYLYKANAGPNFQSVLLPTVGDGLFELYLLSGVDWVLQSSVVKAGEAYVFADGGVDQFMVLGIEMSALLDPTSSSAFVTGLTFAGTGAVQMTQTPIVRDTGDSVQAVPVPGTLPLLAIGTLLVRRRRAA